MRSKMKIVIDLEKDSEMYQNAPAYTAVYALHKARDVVMDAYDVGEIRRPIKSSRGERIATIHVRKLSAGWGDLT
jgi:hypothetical protein